VGAQGAFLHDCKAAKKATNHLEKIPDIPKYRFEITNPNEPFISGCGLRFNQKEERFQTFQKLHFLIS
jgi:hypothetical protein